MSNACGVELAESAIVPDTLAALMEHVASNLSAHAAWVGAATAECAAEHSGLIRLAGNYRSIAAAARAAADTMRSLAHLLPAPHDPAGWDRVAFAAWMARKIQLQTELAQVLFEHANQSQEVLDRSPQP